MIVRSFLTALQFLTILPIRLAGEMTEKDLARSKAFFPLAGAVTGLITAGGTVFFLFLLPPIPAAALTLGLFTLLVGAFHLDGLADTADALAVPPTGDAARDRQRRLAVMKDSAAGAVGVVALGLVILTKYVFLAHLFTRFSLAAVIGLLILLPAVSKWAIVLVMYWGHPARPDGLGRIFLVEKDKRSLGGASLILFLLFLLVLPLMPYQPLSGAAILMGGAAGLYLWSRAATFYLTQKFSGLTGDHFGAVNETAELFFLTWMALW
jgi:adenosylcobinamide-GDP ribazoletransferase